MAIYHLNVRYCSKSKGQSSQAKNDYINRNDRYSKRLDDLKFSGFGNMPKFAENEPQKFWQSSDLYERSNARVCTEIEFALPRELNLEQQKDLVQSFINSTVNSEVNKLPYSFAIHHDKENNNPHCHLIFSERQLDGIDRTEELFFKRANSKNPEKGGAKKTTDFRDKEFIKSVRKTWSEQANYFLEKYGHSARIDERSYQEQGIDKEPRSRIDRVTWQELSRLERKNITLGQEITQKVQEIALEKENIAQNASKNALEQLSKIDTLKYKQEEKTPVKRNQGLSQEDFDNYLISNYLKPIQEIEKEQEKLDKIKTEFDRYGKELSQLQNEYDELHAKNKGFLGLWQSKEQKQRIQEIEQEYARIEKQKIAKGTEYNELDSHITQLKQSKLEPIQKQIEKIQANNPELKMRKIAQLTSMQRSSVFEWNSARERAELERKREQQQKAFKRDTGLSL